MIDRNFDAAFLHRLAGAMRAIAQERADAHDPEPLAPEDDEAIYAAYEESGGDPALAKQEIGTAREECSQAFGRILQYIADQYRVGPVERLDDAALVSVARDAFDATENWLDDVEMLGRAVTPRNRLQVFLETHCRLNEAMLALHDRILWPIARRIAPDD